MEKVYIITGKSRKEVPNHSTWSIPLTAMIITLIIMEAIFLLL